MTPEEKSRVRDTAMKVFAIIGILVILIGAGWAGAQIVQTFPDAFTRVASVLFTFDSEEPVHENDEDVSATSTDEENGGAENNRATSSTPSAPTGTENTTVGTPGSTGVVITPIGTTTPTSNPLGSPDLVITLIDTGIVDTQGTFTPKSPLDQNDRAAIRFSVANIGDKESGTWEFEADLPTRPSTDYDSPNQRSLFPGESIIFTLGFDRLERDEEVTYSITVDQDDRVDESNEQNNLLGGTLEIED